MTLCFAFGSGTCSRAPASDASTRATAPVASGAGAEPRDASAPDSAHADAALEDPVIAAAPVDPMATHYGTQEQLLRLVALPDVDDPAAAARRSSTLAYLVAPAAGHFNQGNPAIAHHSISKRQCLAGLRGVTLQTDEQRAICGGAVNMVPVYEGGDPRSAKACIDVFEFPNQACELPFVWGSPAEADVMCHLEGKRLCADKEWNLACAADPAGGPRWAYAYGDELDMTACHTSVPKRVGPDGKSWVCNTHDAQASWATCATDTEPSGAFPRCRSRLGVYDQHGNVAEEMFRKDGDAVWTQLKGSAWFYVDVGREPGKPAWHPERESYPDTCSYDPRWHVEDLKRAQHVNYHLGFRCCKDVPQPKGR